MPAIKGAEATLSEAVKEGSEMTTLFYAVAAQNFLGLKGENSVIRRFIKGQAWGKLTGCEDDFGCLVLLSRGKVCLPVKTFCPCAKNICK